MSATEYPETRAAFDKIGKVHVWEAQADVADVLLRAGVRFDPQPFGMRRASQKEADRIRERAWQTRRFIQPDIEEANEVAAERIMLALQLLLHPKFQEKNKHARELKRYSIVALRKLSALAPLMEEQIQLKRWAQAAFMSIPQQTAGTKGQVIEDALDEHNRHISVILEGWREKLARIPYPFSSGTVEVTTATHVLGTFPTKPSVAITVQFAQRAAQRLTQLYERLLGRLILVCEQVEKNLGIFREPMGGRDLKSGPEA